MSNNLLKIKACKCLLVLSENELLNGLRSDILQSALNRGKGYRRAASCERRQNCVDRWRLYEWLKGNCISEDAAFQVDTMNTTELREGVIEFLLMKRRETCG